MQSAVKEPAQNPPEIETRGKHRSARFSDEQRQQMIAEAAYYIAEKRGFQDGCPTQDWLEAEAIIDRQYFCISSKLRNSLVFL